MKKLLLTSMLCFCMLMQGCTISELDTAEDKIVNIDGNESNWITKDIEQYSDNNVVTMEQEEIEIPQNPTFRNTEWKMNKERVIALEGEPTDNYVNALVYKNVSISSFSTELVYFFDKDECLYSAYYDFQQNHTNSNLYIDDFNIMLNLLTEKYGTPEYSGPEWNDTHYKDRKEKWGMAVSRGDVAFKADWKTKDTEIFLLLDGDNYNCKMYLSYETLNYVPNVDSELDGL